MADGPEYHQVPLDELHFDPENPRLRESIDAQDLSQVLKFMLEDAGLLDLMGSIALQGFFPGEPLLVAPDARDSRLIVVEGNRRFASVLLLTNPGLAPTRKKAVIEAAAQATSHDLATVPCLLFADRDAILGHLGYRHVTGIKEWEPLAKARFLYQRFKTLEGTDGERFKLLARSIGSRADYVGRLLTAHQLYVRMDNNNFYDLEGVDSDTIEFSLISSVLAYNSITLYLGLQSSQDLELETLDDGRLHFLTQFVFQRIDGHTALGESRNIRVLADVLDVPRAREALESGTSLSAAATLAGAGADAFRSFVASAKESLDLAFHELADAPINGDDLDAVTLVKTTAEELELAGRKRLG